MGAIHRHTGQRSAPDPSVETFEQWPIRMNQSSTAISTKIWRMGREQQKIIPTETVDENRKRKMKIELIKELNQK